MKDFDYRLKKIDRELRRIEAVQEKPRIVIYDSEVGPEPALDQIYRSGERPKALILLPDNHRDRRIERPGYHYGDQGKRDSIARYTVAEKD